MTRRDFLAVAAGSGLTLSIDSAASAEESTPASSSPESPPLFPLPERPHVVFIILDTVRADKLGCYGYPHETSPALDRLAARGIRFDRVIAQCNWTRPSVGSVLTSLYPRTLGLYHERGEILNSRFDTLPMHFKRAGYRTLGITANPNLNTVFNFDQGYDEYTDTKVVFPWMRSESYREVRGISHLPSAPDMYRSILEATEGKGDTPTFVFVNAMEVHEWYITKPMIREEYRSLFTDVGEKYPSYLQSLRQLTDDTGRFVEQFTARPGFENTLFCFISDHGESLDEHEPIEHSTYHGWHLYESQVIVPWILYCPAWTGEGAVIRQPVRLLELMPTLLDLAGLPVPTDVEGRSMLPAIRGTGAVDLPEYFVTETHWRMAGKIAAYANDWKFIDNRMKYEFLPRTELQSRGYRERGVFTDKLKAFPEIGAPLAAFLKGWELAYPRAAATPPQRELSDEERQQLEAIGYNLSDTDTPNPVNTHEAEESTE
jgi:arylsulfatase A-like enzyme